MTSRLVRARQGAPSTGVIVAVFAGLFAVIAVAGIAASRHDNGPSRRVLAERTQVTAYEDAIQPAITEAGRAIVAGIRPDLADFEAGRISADVWANDLTARTADFERARDELAKVRAPAVVGDAPAWFAEAFDTYLAAAKVLAEAGPATGEARSRLLDLGASLGDSGDRLFDRAAARIQAARRGLGLAPSARLPDKRFGDEPT